MILLKGDLKLATITSSATGTFSTGIEFTIANFGDRVASVAANFLQFRIRRLKIMFKSATGTNTRGSYALGIGDDTNVSAGTISTSAQTLALRTRVLKQIYNNATLRWQPINKYWYYVNPETSNSDQRLIAPGFVFIVNDVISGETGLSQGTLECQYEIELKGATLVAV